MGRGDAFPALDEAGNHFLCSIEEASPEAVVVALSPEAKEMDSASDLPHLGLIQALPKGPKMDLILRQAVEAGVSAVFPVQTKNCVVREKRGTDREDKLERRRTIVREALQQSGSSIRTKILPTETIETLEKALEAEGFSRSGSLRLMFHELPLAEKSLHEYCAGELLPTLILIGPEGGFAPEETDAFKALGFKLVHLDGTILRTETAALFAMAAVKTILMERAAWILSK